MNLDPQKSRRLKMLPRKAASFCIALLAFALLLDWPGTSFPQHISTSQGDVEASLAPRSDAVHHGLPERDLNVRITAEVQRPTELTGSGAGSDHPPATNSRISLFLTRYSARYCTPVRSLPYGVKYARTFDARAPPHRTA